LLRPAGRVVDEVLRTRKRVVVVGRGVWREREARRVGRRSLTEAHAHAQYTGLQSTEPELHSAFTRFFQLRAELQMEDEEEPW
jgi:hypothetical protein